MYSKKNDRVCKVYSLKCICKHMIPIMATGEKWLGMCLAFLFCVSLLTS